MCSAVQLLFNCLSDFGYWLESLNSWKSGEWNSCMEYGGPFEGLVMTPHSTPQSKP